MSLELQTIIDLIRYGASRFNAAGLTFGHSYDNALDEATQLTLHALHLPHDLPPAYGNARITEAEKEDVLALFVRRIEERLPACYLTGEAWFAGLSFKSDARALVPRSPIAELIESGFQPWLGDREAVSYTHLDVYKRQDVSYAYNPDGSWTHQHQMSLQGKRDHFELDDLIGFGRFCGLKPAKAKRMIEDIHGQVVQWLSLIHI